MWQSFYRHPVVKFLASLRLAVCLIVMMIVMMTWGTITESNYGAEYARVAVYESHLFLAIEVLLFLNILFAALVRLPPQTRLTGFYIVHTGLLMILCGSAITSLYGVDGAMELLPSEAVSQVRLREPHVYAALRDSAGRAHMVSQALPKITHAFSSAGAVFAQVGEYDIVLTKYYPFALAKNNLHRAAEWQYALPGSTEDQELERAALLTLLSRANAEKSVSVWVSSAEPVKVDLPGGGQAQLFIGPKIVSLPFALSLTKFKMETNPGTNDPASFESVVEVAAGPATESRSIYMNHPLKRAGYTLYQSSYFQMGDGQYGSVLSVNRDPGRAMKYAGSLLLVLGCILHFVLRSRRVAYAVIVLLQVLFLQSPVMASDNECPAELAAMPVLSGGRVRALTLHARERIKFITGKTNLLGHDALQIYCRISLHGVGIQNVASVDIPIRVNHRQTRLFLGLTEQQGKISFDEANTRLAEMQTYASALKQRGNQAAFAKDLAATVLRVQLVADMQAGHDWLLPVSHERDGKAGGEIQWTSLADWHARGSDANKDSETLIYEILKLGADYNLSSDDKYLWELTYDRLQLFHWAILIIIISLLSAGVTAHWRLPVALAIIALGVEITAMVFRVVISGRAPVTNMYETVMWGGFGALLFAVIGAVWRREKLFLMVGLAFNLCCLFLMTLATDMLDPAIRPLVPVLRDNFWLSTHVTAVTLSYAALALSWFLANYFLIRGIFVPAKVEFARRISSLCYDAIKLGVVLLALGIILGGVWADYSWGRFWGWDPKETWSLIALMTYMAVLHARLVGWLKPERFVPMIALSFLSIIMAWFGVNYVLAAGLHSYGFSEGGTVFVLGLITVQFLIVLVHAWRQKTRHNTQYAE